MSLAEQFKCRQMEESNPKDSVLRFNGEGSGVKNGYAAFVMKINSLNQHLRIAGPDSIDVLFNDIAANENWTWKRESLRAAWYAAISHQTFNPLSNETSIEIKIGPIFISFRGGKDRKLFLSPRFLPP